MGNLNWMRYLDLKLCPTNHADLYDFMTYTFSDGDDCEDSGCANGASCVDGIRSYTCTCTQQWRGINCTGNCPPLPHPPPPYHPPPPLPPPPPKCRQILYYSSYTRK